MCSRPGSAALWVDPKAGPLPYPMWLGEIAARTGAHVEAVKSRLKRGLELLRARLDRRFGSRASWCLALTGRLELAPSSAALALHSFGSVSTAFALMSTAKKLSLAVLVVAALAVIVPWRIDAAEVVPGAPRAEDVDGWLAALDRFYREGLAEFAATGTARALIAYQAPVPGTGVTTSSGAGRALARLLRWIALALAAFEKALV